MPNSWKVVVGLVVMVVLLFTFNAGVVHSVIRTQNQTKALDARLVKTETADALAMQGLAEARVVASIKLKATQMGKIVCHKGGIDLVVVNRLDQFVERFLIVEDKTWSKEKCSSLDTYQ